MIGRGIGQGLAARGGEFAGRYAQGGFGRGFGGHGFFFFGGQIFGMLIGLVVVALVVVAFWKLFQKAGFNGALGLLMLVPVVNVAAVLFLAFAQWPARNELEQLRAWRLGLAGGTVAAPTPAPVTEPVAPPVPAEAAAPEAPAKEPSA